MAAAIAVSAFPMNTDSMQYVVITNFSVRKALIHMSAPVRPVSTPQPLSTSSSILVKLDARPDFNAIKSMPRGAERKQAAFEALTATAAQSQKPFISLTEQLKENGAIAGYETLVSPNMLVITPQAGKGSQVLSAFKVPGVKAIYSNSSASSLWRPETGDIKQQSLKGKKVWGLDVVNPRPRAIKPIAGEKPYGVDMVGAPDAWRQGATGKGLVFGSIDTGADVTHEAISGNYRGRNADGTLNHDYNWMSLDQTKKAPNDSQGHGTHTIGTTVGAGPNSVGVAPEAKWIAVQGLTNATKPVGLLKALQWMQAPTKADGTGADPTKAPDVVGMSWWTGPANEDFFHESIQDLRAAGIVPVKSAGNRGPGVGTISSPGQYPEIIATAAVDSNGNVANFSSRGPSQLKTKDGTVIAKPDFAAPGVDTLSAMPGGKYGKMSGTSMAQPHMSGAVLDILSKYPQLTENQLTAVLKASSIDRGAAGHDIEYGDGIINLPAALAVAAKLTATARQPHAVAR